MLLLCRCDDILDLADFLFFRVCVVGNALGLSDLRGGMMTVQSGRSFQ